MNSKKFDYVKYARVVSTKIEKTIPDTVKEEHKKFLTDTIYKFAFMSGEAISKDDVFQTDIEFYKSVVNYISQWSYYSGLQIIDSTIPEEKWNDILQYEAALVFNFLLDSIASGKFDDPNFPSIFEKEVYPGFSERLNEYTGQGYNFKIDHMILKNTNKETFKNKIDYFAQKSSPINIIFKRKPSPVAEILLVIFVLSLIPLLIFEMPFWSIDFALTLLFSIAVVMLMTSLYINKPVESVAYPSIILISSVFKLILSVAVVRQIFLYSEAGEIIDFLVYVLSKEQIYIGGIILISLAIIQLFFILNGCQNNIRF